ncbi:SHOCT domain-containing protein [Aquimarina aggregata]|uniref:SHOCT domain-containing protein n=1 Tax=Aquimarina aggregata TaxID=1642818 RepID=UPI002492E3A1|nr:SHOCT domain-containing protein [Aquimarina aggregata]
MKKITFLFITISALIFNIGHAQKKVQKLTEYKASNDVIYKTGDRIKMGKGSSTNGDFVYLKIAGWMAGSPDATPIGSAYAGMELKIKKIKRYNHKMFKGVYFTIGGGNIVNYNLDIENAISTCEIQNCTGKTRTNIAIDDKYDQLKKIKKLFDDGILSEEEYKTEKTKILSSN